MCLQDWFREKMDEGKFTYNKFVGFCCFHYLLLSTNHPCFLCAAPVASTSTQAAGVGDEEGSDSEC